MNSSDEQIGAALRRLAGQLDPKVPEPPIVEPARRWTVGLLAAAIVVVALVTVGLVVADRGNDKRVVSSAVDTTIVAPITTSAPSSTVTTVAPTTVARTEDLLTQPVIDMDGCATTWARTYESGGDLYYPYTRRSSKPVAIQIFASPSRSITDPYVVVERFFADQRGTGSRTRADDVNGQPALVVINTTGGGSVEWLLPDGSEVYIRDHLFDKESLLAIARALVPRPVDAPVPGFDIATPAPFGLTLLDETYDPLAFVGGSKSGCTTASGAELQVVVLRGAPVYLFAVYLDQPGPYPPVTMLPDGSGTLAVVSLRSPAEAAAALPTVRQAADDDWQRWLVAPQRADVDMGIGYLPKDQSVLDRLAGQHFASLDEVQTAVIDILTADLPEMEVAETRFSAEVLNGDVVGPVIVVTKPNFDDSVIASVWFIEVTGVAPDLTVTSVSTASRCRGGELQRPGVECV